MTGFKDLSPLDLKNALTSHLCYRLEGHQQGLHKSSLEISHPIHFLCLCFACLFICFFLILLFLLLCWLMNPVGPSWRLSCSVDLVTFSPLNVLSLLLLHSFLKESSSLACFPPCIPPCLFWKPHTITAMSREVLRWGMTRGWECF